jgi:hypothetical protein
MIENHLQQAAQKTTREREPESVQLLLPVSKGNGWPR